MREEIKQLIDLQDCDSRIEDVRKQLHRAPARFGEFEQELIRMEQMLEAAQSELGAKKRSHRDAEREIDVLEERIAKSHTKLSNIKSNREYRAALKEVDDLKREKSLLEDKALELMEDIEALQEQYTRSQKEAEQIKEAVRRNREKLKEELSVLEAELERLEKDRSGFSDRIDQSLLNRYDFIRKHKGGLALSPVIEAVCLTCHMGIPPQKFNELIRGEELMSCPNCSRIIYWGEDERFKGAAPDDETGMLEQNK